MSLDMYVQRFRSGGTAFLSAAAFDAVFGPYVDLRKLDYGYWHLRATDGGEADIYANTTSPTFASLLINHFSEGAVLDLVAEFARRVDAVIMPVGCPVLLTSEVQRDDLPADLADDARVITDGQGISAAIHGWPWSPVPQSQ